MSAPPRKLPADPEIRGHLTPDEVVRLMKAAGKTGRHRHRDQTLILMAYRHGFRVCELVGLRRAQIDLTQGQLYVKRRKKGNPASHRLLGDEIRAMRRIYRDYGEDPYVFISERGGPLTVRAVFKIVARAGVLAKIGFPVHTHMLRHACGYKLANDGQDTRAIQDYLGHRNIQHTVTYTKLAKGRFDDFFSDEG
jgi:type 1 fimbriae regulatory protein FimB/type 1 fimbriae regulatory protein FimE